MTALAHDENVKWYWAPIIANIAAPTVAEVTTAGKLIPLITNYSTPSSEAEVDVSGVDDIYDLSVVGTSKSGPIELTMKRDDTAANEVNTWTLFSVFRQTGYLVKSSKGVPIGGAKVEVYPAQVGQRRPEGYGRNTAQKFMVSFYVTSKPELDATMTA